MTSTEDQYQHNALVSKPLQWLAQLISFLFHPVFILSYAYILLALYNPYLFGESSASKIFKIAPGRDKGLWFLNLFFFSCVIPILGIAMMKGLGVIKSIRLQDQEDRKLPYILTGMFYISMVAQQGYDSVLPIEVKIFSLGATIALFLAFFINLFNKISMHGTGMGGFMAMILIIIFRSHNAGSTLFVAAAIACGLVGTARLVLGAHKPNDLYGGYLIGFFSQFFALNYLLN